MCAPTTAVAVSLNCKRSWRVPCGTLNDAPSARLGKVSCGDTDTGSIRFLNVLYEPEAALRMVGVITRVQDPTID